MLINVISVTRQFLGRSSGMGSPLSYAQESGEDPPFCKAANLGITTGPNYCGSTSNSPNFELYSGGSHPLTPDAGVNVISPNLNDPSFNT
jgi:hypothetical protein